MSRGGSKADLTYLTPMDASEKPWRKMAFEDAEKKRKAAKRAGHKKSAHDKKKPAAEERPDHYRMIGLSQLRWQATEKQIKDAYRRACLVYHPDKCMAEAEDDEEKQQIEEYFKRVQLANEVLSDKAKRRVFDSTEEDIDDSLPRNCDVSDFFDVFGAAFKRQSRFSEKRNPPQLGGPDDDEESVKKFYDFWYGFKSWREFPHEDEWDLAEAECREDRRWMERNNAKMREKGKKYERERIRDFVERAEAIDPRMEKMRARERDAREAAKAEKRRAREEVEAAKVAAEEAAKAADAAAVDATKSAKKKKEEERKKLQKERKRLRMLASSEYANPPYAGDRIEELCSTLNLNYLRRLCALIEEAGPSSAASVVEAQAAKVLDSSDMADLDAVENVPEAPATPSTPAPAPAPEYTTLAAAPVTPVPVAAAPAVVSSNPGVGWTDEEMRKLDKALMRFPSGTSKRWEKVTAMVGTRPQDDVIAVGKMREESGGGNASASQGHVIKEKHMKNVSIGDAPSVRDDGVEVAAEEESEDADADSASAEKPWTAAETSALIKAMRAFPNGTPSRWEKVAEGVPGRSKAECMKHFTNLRSKVRGKK